MSNTKWLRFKRKMQVFFKRNALAIVICTTTVLTLAIVGFSAFYSLKPGETQNTVNNQPNINTPVSSTDPVVFVSPLDVVTISKEYAGDYLLEDKTTGIWQTHQALDFAANDGDVVKAVYAGTIEKIENSMMDGTIITLKISDDLKVVYKSMASDVLVKEGDSVTTGQELGTAGTNVTEKAEGVHLHLEVYEGDKLVDPNNYFSFNDK